MKLNPSFLLLTPFLLLAGCGGTHNYTTNLNLPALDAPPVLAPINPADTSFAPFIDPIQNATTTAQADAVVAHNRLSATMISKMGSTASAGDTPQVAQEKQQRADEMTRLASYLDQAAQIKRAELADGDNSDKSGEVKARVEYAKQSVTNLEQLDKDLPPGTQSSLTTVQNAVAGDSPGARGALIPVEQRWVDNVKAASAAISEYDFDLSLDARAAALTTDFTNAKAKYFEIVPPPRFTNVDLLYRQVFDAGSSGCDSLQRAVNGSNSDELDKSRQYFDQYHTLKEKADAALEDTLKSIQGSR